MVWCNVFGGLIMYNFSQWDFFWMAFKPLIPVILICIAVFAIFFYFWRWYIRKIKQRDAEEEAMMKATLSPEDFNQWLLRRQIRRAANTIFLGYYFTNGHYFTNNKKGN